MMRKSIMRASIAMSVILAAVAVIGLIFPLEAAALFYRSERADPAVVWQFAQDFENISFEESFDNAPDDWKMFINGNGELHRPPAGPAASVAVENGMLVLSIHHDPEFNDKGQAWTDTAPAPEAYNNAFATSENVFLPQPGQKVVIEVIMETDSGFPGSTGVFVEEQDTFDENGVSAKSFRAFAFSYNPSAAAFLQGMRATTALGLSLPCLGEPIDVDPSERHTYVLEWQWVTPTLQQVTYYVDGIHVYTCEVDPFGPAEVQLWADNYQIRSIFDIGYLNPSQTYNVYYDSVRVWTEPVD